jgi:DNA-binding response OmpR family regulator
LSKILIVDDEREITNILGEFFAKKGFQVIECNGGKDALCVLMNEKEIDALVLDNKMPEVDGFAVLRKMEELRIEIPTVLLSGTLELERKNIESKNVKAVLIKPVDLTELLDRVNVILKHKGGSDV